MTNQSIELLYYIRRFKKGSLKIMTSFSVTLTIDVDVSKAIAFEYNVPIDLTSIFTGFGPLPAVIGTKNQTGGWDGEGQTRTVLFSDGSSAQEMLTKYEHPNYFSYSINRFKGMLQFLVSSAEGEWWFKSASEEKTDIKWRYGFNAKSIFVVPLLWFFTHVLWRKYMYNALILYKEQVESQS